MHPKIKKAIEAFHKAALDPLPGVLRQNESATFLVCMNVAALTDALSGWRYEPRCGLSDPQRFTSFVREYFPASYSRLAVRLYKFRCRALHNFSPAGFTLKHCAPKLHMKRSRRGKGDRYMCATTLLGDFRGAARKLLREIEASRERQKAMLARLRYLRRGGGVAVAP